MLKPIIAIALASFAFAGTVCAEEKTAVTQPAYPTALLNEIRPGSELGNLLENTPRMLTRYDRNDNGLDAADIAYAEQSAQAQYRASAASSMLRLDLNADNKVTKDEVAAASAQRPRVNEAIVESQMRRLLRDDVNGDGTLTLDEALAGAVQNNCRRSDTTAAQLLALDPDKDGKLTQDELDKVATGVFKIFDANGDGVISLKEYEAARPILRAAMNEPPRNPDCLMR